METVLDTAGVNFVFSQFERLPRTKLSDLAPTANMRFLFLSNDCAILSILPVLYCRVVENVGEVVSTVLGRMKLSRANRSLYPLVKQINRIEESFLSLVVF